MQYIILHPSQSGLLHTVHLNTSILPHGAYIFIKNKWFFTEFYQLVKVGHIIQDVITRII